MTEANLIKSCKKGRRKAQNFLYERYAPRFLGLCKRYLSDHVEAEEAMVSGFFKIFSAIRDYKGAGSFEGWMRKIMVNEALMFLRKRYNFKMTVELEAEDLIEPLAPDTALSEADIKRLIDELPTGYRTVFNLYVIEGYKHKEIAEMLSISIHTSKSQLIQAKKRLREQLEQEYFIEAG